MQIKYNDKLTETEKKKINNFTSYLSKHPSKDAHKLTGPIEVFEVDLDPPQVHLHDIMTPGEVAEYLSISYMTLKRWTKAGRINCIRINERGDRRYLRSEITRLLEGKV